MRSYFARHIFAVCFGHHWVFFEYVVNKLRCDHNLDLSVNGLWPRVYQLARLPSLLALGSSLSEEKMLYAGQLGYNVAPVT